MDLKKKTFDTLKVVAGTLGWLLVGAYVLFYFTSNYFFTQFNTLKDILDYKSCEITMIYQPPLSVSPLITLTTGSMNLNDVSFLAKDFQNFKTFLPSKNTDLKKYHYDFVFLLDRHPSYPWIAGYRPILEYDSSTGVLIASKPSLQSYYCIAPPAFQEKIRGLKVQLPESADYQSQYSIANVNGTLHVTKVKNP